MKGDSNWTVPGSTITDTLKGDNHYFDDSNEKSNDKTSFSFVAIDEKGNKRHELGEEKDLNDIKWGIDSQTGKESWSYTFPDSMYCNTCKTTHKLDNDWVYQMSYTTTIKNSGQNSSTGIIYYQNHVETEGMQKDASITVSYGTVEGTVNKQGAFEGDPEAETGGVFHWTIDAIIPGKEVKPTAGWCLQDTMGILTGGDGTIEGVENTINSATITLINNGRTYPVPEVSEATDEHSFAWRVAESHKVYGSSVENQRIIDILCRCTCDETNCQVWVPASQEGKYECQYTYHPEGKDDIKFCHCWNVTGETHLKVDYYTNDQKIIEEHGGRGDKLCNEVYLGYQIRDNDGVWQRVPVDEPVRVDLGIPGAFKKNVTKDFDGQKASYTITINEGKIPLTKPGKNLEIHDEMSETLVYEKGSLVITAEDAQKNIQTLEEGTHYTVTYYGDGEKTDEAGNKVHVLDIVLLDPQPVMYTLTYDATLNIPPGTTGQVVYTNKADVTLWNHEFESDPGEKVYGNINISGETRNVTIHKTTDADPKSPLPGAIFGLYSQKSKKLLMQQRIKTATLNLKLTM